MRVPANEALGYEDRSAGVTGAAAMRDARCKPGEEWGSADDGTDVVGYISWQMLVCLVGAPLRGAWGARGRETQGQDSEEAGKRGEEGKGAATEADEGFGGFQLPADKVSVALLLVRERGEVLPDLEADDRRRGIGQVLGELLGVHIEKTAGLLMLKQLQALQKASWRERSCQTWA